MSRRLKLRDLHILFAVVRAGSMAKAAAQVGITQPAISQAVGDLEATLGVRLLDRGPEALDALKQGVRDIEFLADPSSPAAMAARASCATRDEHAGRRSFARSGSSYSALASHSSQLCWP